jgi:hypothetical protein
VIWPIYLLEAAIEVALIVGWIVVLTRGRGGRERSAAQPGN